MEVTIYTHNTHLNDIAYAFILDLRYKITLLFYYI